METELILLLVAALIAGINKLMEVARDVRRKSVEEQQRREQRAGVELEEEAPQPIAKRRQAKPKQRAPLPIPEFNVPLPIPEVLAPRPPEPVPEPEQPKAVRRPRPRRTLQLGGEPREQLRPAPLRAPTPRPQPAAPKVARAKIAGELRDPERIRQAIILREVLGPPIALRHKWQR